MKPENLKTRIFLDSGDVEETKQAISLIGFLDGQTTNPTYFAKSPLVQQRIKTSGKYTLKELLDSYKNTVSQISDLIPQGSVSIEVYADKFTKAEAMFKQAKEMNSWIPNAHIKFPIIPEGVKAAHKALEAGIRVNMTLCFTQEQAAAVYALSRGAKRGDVFVSPFMGRHFDAGRNGLDFVSNVIRMYNKGDGHVEVLAASLRDLSQFFAAISNGADIITAGFKYIKEWSLNGLSVPKAGLTYDSSGLQMIPYQDISLDKQWDEYDISQEMTAKGLDQFSNDWNSLISK
ncbi:MAG: transaldolase family protein [bacterium]|nr:transaldolase family protein [bacterium]